MVVDDFNGDLCIGLGGVAGSAGRNIQAMLARGGIC